VFPDLEQDSHEIITAAQEPSKILSMYSQATSEPSLEELERKLGYAFTDKSLLRAALRHRSWTSEVSDLRMINISYIYAGPKNHAGREHLNLPNY